MTLEIGGPVWNREKFDKERFFIAAAALAFIVEVSVGVYLYKRLHTPVADLSDTVPAQAQASAPQATPEELLNLLPLPPTDKTESIAEQKKLLNALPTPPNDKAANITEQKKLLNILPAVTASSTI